MSIIDEAYLRIRDDVYDAKYKPNELLVEKEIAQRYKISKATASEVLHRLCAEGHLSCYPRSGYMVRTLSPKEMEQLKRLRIVIESLVIDVICIECTEDQILTLKNLIKTDFKTSDGASSNNRNFHLGMAKLTEDKYLIMSLETILGSCSRVEQFLAQENVEQWQCFHLKIVDCLLAKNPVEAKKRLIEDINQR